jgi:hypothetical protein
MGHKFPNIEGSAGFTNTNRGPKLGQAVAVMVAVAVTGLTLLMETVTSDSSAVSRYLHKPHVFPIGLPK